MDNAAMYGFRPHQGRFAAIQSLAEPRVVATGYQAAPAATNVDLHIGDPVELVADGSVALCNATPADVYGVIVAVRPYWDGSRMRPTSYLPGGTAWGTIEERRSEVMVVPFSVCKWEVDVDDAVTATTEAAYRAFIGENCDLSYSPDATLKKAFPKLAIAGHGTATKQFRIVGISGRGNQDFSGANVKLIVVPNELDEAPFTVVGV